MIIIIIQNNVIQTRFESVLAVNNWITTFNCITAIAIANILIISILKENVLLLIFFVGLSEKTHYKWLFNIGFIFLIYA